MATVLTPYVLTNNKHGKNKLLLKIDFAEPSGPVEHIHTRKEFFYCRQIHLLH